MASILALLISLGAVGAVLYTPALPDLTDAFGTSPGAAQFTVTI
jgi:hypothetical protein